MYEVLASERTFVGEVVTVRVDKVRMPDGTVSAREVIEHDDVVAVVALDPDGRVLLIRQYRHPLRARLWELPAGLRDAPGESWTETAARELAEEAALAAGTWHALLDVHPSPGTATYRARIYLARDLHDVEPDHEPSGEEADLETRWVPLDEAVAQVEAGEITNALAVTGLFAAARARDRGFEGLREAPE
ncbi:MAG TPA: NUDIX hydrolase [Mycobacteriales bacterium]|nr:NUDIX hydrolase [Mycobacteriales bacterium]